MNIRRPLVTLLAGTLLSACTQLAAYRLPVDTQDLAGMREVSVSEDPRLTEAHAIQHRAYTYGAEYAERSGNESPASAEGDYYLSFVEFDDQGWFADRRQMDQLLALLDQLEKLRKETLIHVYAHGWMHDASPGDSNVVYFSRLLERTDVLERLFLSPDQDPARGRTVVGVYLGWRGLPYNASVFNSFSFWNRKDTAARVGRGGVFELLVRLNDYRTRRRRAASEKAASEKAAREKAAREKAAREKAASEKAANSSAGEDVLPTQLVITGHSFGGLVIYSALSHALMERAAKATRRTSDDQSPPAERATVEGFGDLVMLVNPAFEGSLYEPLRQLADESQYSDTQRPLMVIVTSEADAATRVAFPVGQTLGTLFDNTSDSYQSNSLRKAIGHNTSYQTHRLFHDQAEVTGSRIEEPDQASGESDDEMDPDYPRLLPTANWDPFSLWNLLNFPDPDGVTAATHYGPGVKLLPTSYETGDPFLIVSTDKHVIADHSAIYNERFITFTQMFLLRYVTFRCDDGPPPRLPGTPAAATDGSRSCR